METQKNNRHILAEAATMRAAAEGNSNILEGYASVFNHRSKLIFDWGDTYFEVIEPGAFDDALRAENLNVIATVNHRRDLMLGRTKSNTLRLTVDERGLKYDIDIPDTSLGRDTKIQVERGDFFESSFVYTVQRENIRWDETEDGVPVRYIKKVDRLYDVSIVTDGAFSNTDIAAREYKEYREQKENEQQPHNVEAYARKLTLRKHKK